MSGALYADFSFVAETRPFLCAEITDEHAVALWLTRTALLWRQIWQAVAAGASAGAPLNASRLKDRLEWLDLRICQQFGECVGAERKGAMLPGLLEGFAAVWKREKREYATSVVDLFEVLASERFKKFLASYLPSIAGGPNFKQARRDINERFLVDALQLVFAHLRDCVSSEMGSHPSLSSNVRVRDLKTLIRDASSLWAHIMSRIDPTRDALASGSKGVEQVLMIRQLDHAKRLATVEARIAGWIPAEAHKLGIKAGKGDASSSASATPNCSECDGELPLTGEYASVRCSSGCVVHLHEHCWIPLESCAADPKHIACPRSATRGCSGEVLVVLSKSARAVQLVLLNLHPAGSDEWRAVEALVGKNEDEPEDAHSDEGVVAADGDEAAEDGDDDEDDSRVIGKRHARGVKLSRSHTKGAILKSLLALEDGKMIGKEVLAREAEKAEREAKRAEEERRQQEVKTRLEEERQRRMQKEAEEKAAAAAAAAAATATASSRGGQHKKPAIEIALKGAIKATDERPSALQAIKAELAKNNVRDSSDEEASTVSASVASYEEVRPFSAHMRSDDEWRLGHAKQRKYMSPALAAPVLPLSDQSHWPAAASASSTVSAAPAPCQLQLDNPAEQFPPLAASACPSSATPKAALTQTPPSGSTAPAATTALTNSPPLIAVEAAAATSPDRAASASSVSAASSVPVAVAMAQRSSATAAASAMPLKAVTMMKSGAAALSAQPSLLLLKPKQTHMPAPALPVHVTRPPLAVISPQPVSGNSAPISHPIALKPHSQAALSEEMHMAAAPGGPTPPPVNSAQPKLRPSVAGVAAAPPAIHTSTYMSASDVCVQPPGEESRVLLAVHLSPLLTAATLGQQFCSFGHLRVNMLLTARQGLVGVLTYDSIECARAAYTALNGMVLEMQVSHPPDASVDPFLAGEGSVESVRAILELHYAAPSSDGKPISVRALPTVSIVAIRKATALDAKGITPPPPVQPTRKQQQSKPQVEEGDEPAALLDGPGAHGASVGELPTRVVTKAATGKDTVAGAGAGGAPGTPGASSVTSVTPRTSPAAGSPVSRFTYSASAAAARPFVPMPAAAGYGYGYPAGASYGQLPFNPTVYSYGHPMGAAVAAQAYHAAYSPFAQPTFNPYR